MPRVFPQNGWSHIHKKFLRALPTFFLFRENVSFFDSENSLNLFNQKISIAREENFFFFNLPPLRFPKEYSFYNPQKSNTLKNIPKRNVIDKIFSWRGLFFFRWEKTRFGKKFKSPPTNKKLPQRTGEKSINQKIAFMEKSP